MRDRVIGWDVGGAHLKASLFEEGRLRAVGEWACPLWQGLEPLERALAAALDRWPGPASHAVTMTGEMVDLFPHREAGVLGLAACLQARLDGPVAFYAGLQGWASFDTLRARWADVASANWLATAGLAAQRVHGVGGEEHGAEGVLVDIGSTTTDLVALQGGRVRTDSRSDRDRLASGELLYMGVVRTPLCALTQRIVWQGRPHHVMNEWFATTADVYRLTGELDAAHDLHPAADQGAKTLAASRQRLARMIGSDAREADRASWLAFAEAWREAQLDATARALQQVGDAAGLSPQAPLVGAGCGDFLAEALAARLGRPYRRFADLVLSGPSARHAPTLDEAASALRRWAQVAAPSVAVAAAFVDASGHASGPGPAQPPGLPQEASSCGS